MVRLNLKKLKVVEGKEQFVLRTQIGWQLSKI
jgi:hypothetical protein